MSCLFWPSNTSHGSDANGTGVWWMQTLDVADSMVVICGTWFWKNSIEARHSVGCVPHWMKVCYIKNLEVNGGMVSATCINLPAALRCTEAALWMTSSRWMGLEEYQGSMMKNLPCCTICPRAFTPWHLHLISATSACENTRPANFTFWMQLQSEPGQWLIGLSIRALKGWLWPNVKQLWRSAGHVALSKLSSKEPPSLWGFFDASLDNGHGQQTFKVWCLTQFLWNTRQVRDGQKAFRVSSSTSSKESRIGHVDSNGVRRAGWTENWFSRHRAVALHVGIFWMLKPGDLITEGSLDKNWRDRILGEIKGPGLLALETNFFPKLAISVGTL